MLMAIAVAEPATTTTLDRLRAHQVRTIEDLHEISGQPSPMILEKHTGYLTPLIEEFIKAAPFFLIATADADGNCDVSPKGDQTGVVKVLDARTLVIPDRLGNRRVDGHRKCAARGECAVVKSGLDVVQKLRITGVGRAVARNSHAGTVQAVSTVGSRVGDLASRQAKVERDEVLVEVDARL